MSSTRPSLRSEKKHWWLTNRKIVDRHIAEALSLLATQDSANVSAALTLLDSALAISPRHDAVLELMARSLLFLRRFKDVADMLQEYIPSFRAVSEDDDSATSLSSNTSSSSSQQFAKERIKLLSSQDDGPFNGDEKPLWCFSVSELKRRVLAGLCNSNGKEGQWRYIVLGQACCHLGMMEDAMVLLQTGRRLASAAFRRESHDLHGDKFSKNASSDISTATSFLQAPQPTELESAAHLLNHIKLLLRRRSAAVAALEAGMPAEAIRSFSKILDGRRGIPHTFAASCLLGRASAYKAAGRIAESVADCNRALAIDQSSIPALRARANLVQSIQSIPDCLRDLDHLKLLYDAILRDRKLPGPAWRLHGGIRYRDIPGCLRELTPRIQELRQRVAKGEGCSVDYHALIGVQRGCSRWELERTHLLLSIRHRPDKAGAFVDRVEFGDEHRDLDTVRDQARMSALILYRLLQKGYSSIMSVILEEEAADKQRLKEAAAAAASTVAATAHETTSTTSLVTPEKPTAMELDKSEVAKIGVPKAKNDSYVAPILARPEAPAKASAAATAAAAAASVFQGVFCRDLAVVSSLLSQVGFNQPLPVKYEALSC